MIELTLTYRFMSSDDLSESRGGSDTLPLGWHHWQRQTANTVPPGTLPCDRRRPRRQDASHLIRVRYPSVRSHCRRWSRGVVGTHLCKPFVWWAAAARWPQQRASLAVPPSHGITRDPLFAVGDWVSRCEGTLWLIFRTASVKLYFITLLQSDLHQPNFKITGS